MCKSFFISFLWMSLKLILALYAFAKQQMNPSFFYNLVTSRLYSAYTSAHPSASCWRVFLCVRSGLSSSSLDGLSALSLGDILNNIVGLQWLPFSIWFIKLSWICSIGVFWKSYFLLLATTSVAFLYIFLYVAFLI